MPAPGATAELMSRIFAPLAARPVEACAILYLDAQQRLVGVRHVMGTVGSVDLSVRTVATDALTFGAHAAVMAHNHPSGDPRPSRDDVGFTRTLRRGLDALGVRLGDHVVLTRDRHVSLRAEGLL